MMDLVTCQYGCDGLSCDFGGDSKNGIEIAAQHHQKYGHATWVDTIYTHRYGSENDSE